MSQFANSKYMQSYQTELAASPEQSRAKPNFFHCLWDSPANSAVHSSTLEQSADIITRLHNHIYVNLKLTKTAKHESSILQIWELVQKKFPPQGINNKVFSDLFNFISTFTVSIHCCKDTKVQKHKQIYL